MTLTEQQEIKILKNLISINTINGKEARVANYIKELLDQYNIKNEVIHQKDNRDNLIAEIGEGNGKKLAFSGHEDTVDISRKEDWDSNPLVPTIKDNLLYGRGSTDMKSGLAAFVIAIINLSQEHLKGTLRLIVTISEELNQGGANYLSNHLDYVNDLDAIVIGEGTSVDSSKLQSTLNTSSGIAEKDKNILINELKKDKEFEQHFIINSHTGNLIYTIVSKGKAAHSSTPKLGINAINNLIDYRLKEGKLFKEICKTKDNQLGPTIYTPDVFHGGKQVNSIPDYAYEKVMVRTIPEITNDKIIEKLKQIINKLNQNDGYNLSIKITFNGYPVKNSKNSKLVNLFQENAKNIFSDEPLNLPTRTSTLGADDSMFALNHPTLISLIIGPGNTTAHRTNEYVSLDSYHKIIKLYEKVAKIYLNN